MYFLLDGWSFFGYFWKLLFQSMSNNADSVTRAINKSKYVMSLRFYITFLLVSYAASDETVVRRSGNGQTPVKIWSINTELDMNQQTADVHVRGPKNVQTKHEDEGYIIRIHNSQQPETQNKNTAMKEGVSEDDPVPSTKRRPKVVAVIASSCCQGCEAPLAVHVLHRIAQVICMVVVVCMWVLLIVGVLMQFQ
ncbi:hypothetical protein E2C01_029297 [Portunus trituberculatus]|uniref:Uncharacterized protein n=1 Tax=Portunus trituberculatus TaxID=210409 RepID=A0A5B7EMN1_PORTR|nr:hypothetical protein [Portunus trituberculatus]